MAESVYVKLEQRIAANDRGWIMDRWEYGRELLKAKAGRKQLPHGMIADRIAEAVKTGRKLSEAEIRYRVQCAEVYETRAEVVTAVTTYGSWTALREAGFPAVDVGESDLEPEELETIGEPDPYVEEPLFDIPGFKPVLKIRGRKVDLADATVREAVDYRDMCHEMHASFGRTVDQVDASVESMLAGSGGDLNANAVEAWLRGTGVADSAPRADGVVPSGTPPPSAPPPGPGGPTHPTPTGPTQPPPPPR